MTVVTLATDALAGFHLELEVTRRCQLTCPGLCYAQAGPTEDAGTMTIADWVNVMDDAKAGGAELVQLIGGEPTTHPDFALLLGHAIEIGLTVEVFSNLYNLRPHMWELLAQPRVRLATSYHSDDADEHDRITARPGSHARTRGNIVHALELGIPLRAGIIQVTDSQRVEQARVELEALGVNKVRVDRVRPVGRAARSLAPSPAMLCGRCGDHKAAISTAGDVAPCVLGRSLVAGNVKNQRLADIVTSGRWVDIMTQIPRPVRACNPNSNGNDCAPAETEACGPAY
jgi:MoaA/NifB/PqqE/SkfB family radical SAM enzyme